MAEVNGWIAIVPAHGHGEFLRSITGWTGSPRDIQKATDRWWL